MIRKLISVGLCSMGMLALVGAAQAQEANQTEFITATIGTDFAKAIQPITEGSYTLSNTFVTEEVLEMVEEVEEPEEVVLVNPFFQVNGSPVKEEVDHHVIKGVTYVSLLDMAMELDDTAVCDWNPDSQEGTIRSEHLHLTAKAGQLYLVANGRYLYLEDTVHLEGDKLMVPLSVVVRAFDAVLSWDAETGITSVTTGSGGILSGDLFYDESDLFWLSRVIFAESGNQPLEGQMGVAIVVYNRIADSWYPDTVQGVLAQRNQFTTYRNGALANQTPNASSVIAAKLVMDGGIVKEIAKATHFDSISGSWASYNLKTITVIGGHTFYC